MKQNSKTVFERFQETRLYAGIVAIGIGTVLLYFTGSQAWIALLLIEDDSPWLALSSAIFAFASGSFLLLYVVIVVLCLLFFSILDDEDDSDYGYEIADERRAPSA